MSFEVGASTYVSATPRTRHRIATSISNEHAYLFDLWDNPPAWFEVPATDLQPAIATMLIDAAEAGDTDITTVVARCNEAFARERERRRVVFAGSGAAGAFAVLPSDDRVEIGWIGNARVYHVGKEVVQLSRDHSLLEDYRRAVGPLSEAQLEELEPVADVTTRAIGMEPGAAPDVMTCTLAPGESLVLVPRGIDEGILGDARVRSAKTAEAAAKLVVALAIADDPDGPTGAIVIRRSDEVRPRDHEGSESTRAIRQLVATRPDPETESVIADWCEENGRGEIAHWLRTGSPIIRVLAWKHLANTLEAPLITVASFRSIRDLCLHLPAAEVASWVAWHEELIHGKAPPQRDHYFFVRSFEREADGTLAQVAWGFARELLATIPNVEPARIVPLSEIATEPCPKCRRTGLVVGREEHRLDGARDNAYCTYVYVLCMYEPHVAKIGETGTFWDGSVI